MASDMTEAEALEAAERFAVQCGVPFTPWQRKVMAAVLAKDRDEVEYLAWWEEPTPVIPPSNWTKIKRWFNRVVLRRKGPSLSVLDRTLRDVYAPILRAQLEQASPLMERIKKDRP